MRILITSFTSRPQANGVAEVVAAHADGLAARGHEVTIAAGFDPARALSETPPVVQFAVQGVGNLRNGYRGEVREYIDFVRAWRGDVIMCHGWQHWATDLAVRAFPDQPARKILVSHGFSCHCWPPLTRFPKGLVSWLAWQPYVWRAPAVMRQFDHLVFLADLPDREVYHDLAVARRMGLTNVSCIPSGIHLKEFDAPGPDFRATFGITEKHFLLCVASYGPSKNQLLALRAYAQLKTTDVCLVFIGPKANEYAAELERFTQATRLPGRVLFLEKVPRPLVVAAYHAASVFLCPSAWESGPVVVLEAMAARLPFVSTDVGFVAQLPGGVVVSDEEAMARAVMDLLANPIHREAFGAAGRRACEETYNWERIVACYDELVHSVAARSAIA